MVIIRWLKRLEGAAGNLTAGTLSDSSESSRCFGNVCSANSPIIDLTLGVFDIYESGSDLESSNPNLTDNNKVAQIHEIHGSGCCSDRIGTTIQTVAVDPLSISNSRQSISQAKNTDSEVESGNEVTTIIDGILYTFGMPITAVKNISSPNAKFYSFCTMRSTDIIFCNGDVLKLLKIYKTRHILLGVFHYFEELEMSSLESQVKERCTFIYLPEEFHKKSKVKS